MKFRFIEAEKATYPVEVLCRVLGVSKQGFYAFRKRAPSKRARQDVVDLQLVREAHKRGRGASGYRRVYEDLKRRGHCIGKHRAARLMRAAFLVGRPRRKYRLTTDSTHKHAVVPNRLRRDFTALAPDTVWLADITYIWTSEGWLYLAAVMDLYARHIVGWAIRDRLDAALAVDALTMALRLRAPQPGLIQHSDRGLQYASAAYRDVLEKHGLLQSMSRKADCWDNAPMESFFGTLKRELVDERRFLTKVDARGALFDYIEVFYNRQRLHSALGYMPPVEYERRHAAV